jgi:hypothetical protein
LSVGPVRGGRSVSDVELLYVECGPHGRRVAAVVCCHIIESSDPVGFVENSGDPLDLQAWCERCEKMFVAEGDKTEAFEAFNDRAIVCCVFYAALKATHSVEE